MTIEEYIEKNYPNMYWNEASAKTLAVEYAKYHVELAIKAINKENDAAKFAGESTYKFYYPLSNIK